ncbi:MAG: ABC transporter permease, partial [Candidatus Binatia bacterium]
MSPGGRFGLVVVTALVVVALLAPLLALHDPGKISLGESLRGPSLDHPFGVDRLGRDVCSRLLHGSRVSLAVAVPTVGLSLLAGTLIGLLAGMSGGWIDEILMRLVDVLLAFPGILLAIAMSAVLGPSLVNVVIALSLIGWTGYARLVRAETLSLRARPHVEAARAIGASELRIVALHVLPLLAAPLAVQATFGFAGAIVAESSLSFLGLGAQPPTPSWGSMLNDGRGFLLVAPHVAIFPGLAIFVTVLGINFL